jgi:hypothetical protein
MKCDFCGAPIFWPSHPQPSFQVLPAPFQIAHTSPADQE